MILNLAISLMSLPPLSPSLQWRGTINIFSSPVNLFRNIGIPNRVIPAVVSGNPGLSFHRLSLLSTFARPRPAGKFASYLLAPWKGERIKVRGLAPKGLTRSRPHRFVSGTNSKNRLICRSASLASSTISVSGNANTRLKYRCRI